MPNSLHPDEDRRSCFWAQTPWKVYQQTTKVAASKERVKLYVAFLGINQFRRVGLRFVCWFYEGNSRKYTVVT